MDKFFVKVQILCKNSDIAYKWPQNIKIPMNEKLPFSTLKSRQRRRFYALVIVAKALVIKKHF